MIRRILRPTGWILVVLAVLGAWITVPDRSGGANDSLSVSLRDTLLSKTGATSDGHFASPTFWTITWTVMAMWGLFLAAGPSRNVQPR